MGNKDNKQLTVVNILNLTKKHTTYLLVKKKKHPIHSGVDLPVSHLYHEFPDTVNKAADLSD